MPNVSLAQEISVNTVYLMGGSFVLGALFTLLLLIVVDWQRRKNEQ